jgi:uncharacterized protein
MRKCLRCGLALWAAVAAGWAVDWKSWKPQGYVSDFAGVVDSASKARLEDYAADVRRSTGIHVYLVTIPSLQGEPVTDVAGAIRRAWDRRVASDIGPAPSALFLLSVQDRRCAVDAPTQIIPVPLESDILAEMRPALRANNYGEAMMAAAETIGNIMARAHHAQIKTSLPRKMRPTLANSLPPLPMALALAVLVLFGFLLTRSVRHQGGGLRAFHLSKHSGAPLLASATQTGGGFGSPDSSDKFGGFGGDCGAPSGPGSSSEW